MDSDIRGELIRKVDISVAAFCHAIHCVGKNGAIKETDTKQIIEARKNVFEAIFCLSEFYVKSLENGIIPVKIDYEVENATDKAFQIVKNWVPFNGCN